jgi:hypothetical protein
VRTFIGHILPAATASVAPPRQRVYWVIDRSLRMDIPLHGPRSTLGLNVEVLWLRSIAPAIILLLTG